MEEGNLRQGGSTAEQQHLHRVEKFVSNMGLMLQRMTERVEIIESENLKNTMRYNSFREDYKRLIEEQVDMRTARLKDEFVSLDEIRPVKITIKELEVRLRSKVDNILYVDECQKRDKQNHEADLKLRRQLQRTNSQLDSLYQQLKRTDEKNHEQALQNSKVLEQSIKSNDAQTQQSLKSTDGVLKTLTQQLTQVASKQTELAALIETNRLAFEEQIKSKKLEQHKRFLEFEKRLNEADRRKRQEYEAKLMKFDKSIDEMTATVGTSLKKFGKEVSSVVLKTTMVEESFRKESQKSQERNEIVDSAIERLREQWSSENSQIITELKEIRQKINGIHKQLSEEKEERIIQQIEMQRSIEESRASVLEKEQSVAADEQQRAQSPQSSNRVRIRTRSRLNSLVIRDVPQQPEQAVSGGGDSPVPSGTGRTRNQQTIVVRSHEQLSQVRNKLTELEQAINIVKQMMESKVSFCQIIKLEETKAAKHIVRDVIAKLELMKSLLEKQVPCSDLKEIVFDEAGIKQINISRRSLARSKAQTRQGNSRSSREADKQLRLSNSKLTPTASRSRKRYQTFFDSIQPPTTIFQESRPIFF